MASEILVNVRPSETRVAFLDKGVLADYMIESNKKKGLAGSVYTGKVLRVLPGMQAAFVDIGLDRAAFLYVGDVRSDFENPDAILFEEGQQQDPDRDATVEKEAANAAPKMNIQDLVREGQMLLVQVAKDPLGTKGARITTHVSLPGRYVVFMPTVRHLGVSRRIEDPEERERLRKIVDVHKPTVGGIIVRTAGEGATEESIKTDINYRVLLHDEISKNYKKKKGVGLVHTELDVELRAVRDLLNEDVQRIIVDDSDSHRKIVRFMSQFMPKQRVKVESYTGSQPLFDMYEIDLEVSRSLGRKVWLKSGGYIIIDEAEALVVIDVNTGSFVGKKDLEDTILKTNLEAVREIAHQLRIRNCGGIIIIDFIDMEREVNREKVLQALREELKKDRARTNVSSMSALGLVEMTRKRIRPSLVKTLCEPCSYCEGKGYVKTRSTMAHEIFREIEREAGKKDLGSITVRCHSDVANWIYDEESEMLESMERNLGLRIIFKVEMDFHIEQFEISAEIEALV